MVENMNKNIKKNMIEAPIECYQKYKPGVKKEKDMMVKIVKKSKESFNFITKLFYDVKEKDLPVASVIVTFSDCGSYDELFSNLKQIPPEGSRIAVYRVMLSYLKNFTDFLIKGEIAEKFNDQTMQNLKDFQSDIKDLESNCILFNFECCSWFNASDESYSASEEDNDDESIECEEDYSEEDKEVYKEYKKKPVKTNFVKEKMPVKEKKPIKEKIEKKSETQQDAACTDSLNGFGIKFKKSPNYKHCAGYGFRDQSVSDSILAYAISKGYYIMFGDFSLKALINCWNEEILGPNPLVNIFECDNSITLNFDSHKLSTSSSVQLKMVGQLCPEGKLVLNVMGGTIVVGLDKSKLENNSFYEFEILTVAKDWGLSRLNSKLKSFLINEDGAIGHASFTYKSGSILYVSAGHWIELKEINTNLDVMEKMAKQEWGESNEMYEEIKSLKAPVKESEKAEWNMKKKNLASRMIQQSANCNYSLKNKSKK